MNARLVVLPDIKIPREDNQALKQVIDFIADFQPDEVIQAGAILDPLPQHNANHYPSTERKLALLERADRAQSIFLSPLRAVYKGAFTILLPDPAVEAATGGFPPDNPEPTLQQLLDLDTFRVQAVHNRLQLSPEWLALLADDLKFKNSEIPGNTALNIAKHLRLSVIIGHTGRLGKGSHRVSYNTGQVSILTGVESGTLVSTSDPAFVTNGIDRWQLGFATIEINDRTTRSSLFSFHGRHRAVQRMSPIA